MDAKKLISRVEDILKKHERAALAWSQQPPAQVHFKIQEEFKKARREIEDLLKKELPWVNT